MSFNSPKCKAFSEFALWTFWSVMLAAAFFLLGLSVWGWANL